MKIYPEKLPDYLSDPSHWFYIISGDEPLLVQECCDTLRAHAKSNGFTEKTRFHIDHKFDWDQITLSFLNQSLFAEKKLIELYLPTGKPGTSGAKALQALISKAPEDTLLVLITGKLDLATQKTKWFTAIEKSSIFIPIWPIEAHKLPAFIKQRLNQSGINTDAKGIQAIADCVEGNLLAASQEIEKLKMQYGQSTLSFEQVKDALTDNARFNIFELVDCALNGDANRIARILKQLEQEATAPILILWALAKEIRTLASISHAMRQGQSKEQCFKNFRIWNNRTALVSKGLQRHPLTNWQRLLQMANTLDAMIKGQAKGKVWDELLKLSLLMAGHRLFRKQKA